MASGHTELGATVDAAYDLAKDVLSYLDCLGALDTPLLPVKGNKLLWLENLFIRLDALLLGLEEPGVIDAVRKGNKGVCVATGQPSWVEFVAGQTSLLRQHILCALASSFVPPPSTWPEATPAAVDSAWPAIQARVPHLGDALRGELESERWRAGQAAKAIASKKKLGKSAQRKSKSLSHERIVLDAIRVTHFPSIGEGRLSPMKLAELERLCKLSKWQVSRALKAIGGYKGYAAALSGDPELRIGIAHRLKDGTIVADRSV